MPEPNSGESRDDFVRRCVPQVIRDGTTDNERQAVAICDSIWRRANKQPHQVNDATHRP